MFHRRRFLIVLLALAGITGRWSSPFHAASARPRQDPLLGTWDGTYEPPGVVGGDPFSLQIAAVEGERARGTLILPGGALAFEGTVDRAHGTLAFEVKIGNDPVELELTLHEGKLAGLGKGGPWEWGFRCSRASAEVLERTHAPRAVDFSRERPETFSQVGLETELGFALDELMRDTAEKNKIVGLSVACVVDGELVDVRSLGWEDCFAGVPASDQTRYRWASISKPLTATTAMLLAARGKFDFDADVRSYVPEFPVQEFGGAKVTITPREILCHQSGIVHYEGARRTWREYTSPHPFEELANGLDLFRESPLLAAPRTLYSYSTHAWTLLGLAMERAGKARYADLVKELVLEPLAMKTTEPDYPSRSIPHRTKGYERADERVVESFDDDVSWKLPGGGWTSTVGDLARFGAGVMGSKLLDDAQKKELWTARKLADGKATDVGLGFFLGQLEGERLVSHSGGQRKTSTYLAILPERRLAVAAMCNTEGAPMETIATGALRLLLGKR